MNKNRNKIAAMMMVAAITVSSVAMPVEAAVKNINEASIQIKIENNKEIVDVEVTEDNFEDLEFRNFLRKNFGDLITKEEIVSTSKINIYSDKDIKSLKGIEIFKNLNILICRDEKIEYLDLSNLKNLKNVYCDNNELKTIKLPMGIEHLDCSNNKLKELDLKELTNLKYLDCSDNFIKELNLLENNLIQNVTTARNDINKILLPLNNRTLKELYIGDNEIEKINLDNLILLETLELDNNKIEKINLENNKELKHLNLSNNKLNEINLNNNMKLESINLFRNNLNEINLNNNVMLEYFDVSSNKISFLDLTKNKNLKNFEYVSIEGNRIGKIDFNENIGYHNTINEEIYIKVKNNYIDLEKEFNIKQNDIDNNKLKIESKEIKLEGTKLKWNDKVPNEIIYVYNCGGLNDIKLKVKLMLEKDEVNPPNPNPDQGGSGGSGSTTPDQKPDYKPDEKPNKPSKPVEIQGKIVGKNRYETAAKIADQMGSYNTVILVNSDKSMADGLSAASLSGKKNAPILLVKKDSIPAETKARLENAKNVYIMGGEGVISKKVENQLVGKKVTRIAGKDRYETSAKIANMLGGYKMAFIVNGAKGEADAMSVSAVAAKYGAPILLTNGKSSVHTRKAGVTYFVIGGRSAVSNALADRYDADRIGGVDRYSTNRKVLDEFYFDSKKVYFAKGDTLVDALAASALAKEDGIVLVSKKANHKKLEGKKAIQVGGMDFEIDCE